MDTIKNIEEMILDALPASIEDALSFDEIKSLDYVAHIDPPIIDGALKSLINDGLIWVRRYKTTGGWRVPDETRYFVIGGGYELKVLSAIPNERSSAVYSSSIGAESGVTGIKLKGILNRLTRGRKIITIGRSCLPSRRKYYK